MNNSLALPVDGVSTVNYIVSEAQLSSNALFFIAWEGLKNEVRGKERYQSKSENNAVL